MKRDDLELPLLIGLGGLAAYLFFTKVVPQVANTVRNITAPVVNPLADFYVWLTSSGKVIPSGVILLPDGRTVSVASVAPANIGGNVAMFQYQGQVYYLTTPSDAHGNWAASLTIN